MGQDEAKSYEVDINAEPTRVWQALVDPDLTERYYFGTRVDSRWEQGSQIVYRGSDGSVQAEGTILEIDPSTCLCTTFVPRWLPEDVPNSTSKVRWTIERAGQMTKLRLTEEAPGRDSELSQMITSSWQPILQKLKDVVEDSGS